MEFITMNKVKISPFMRLSVKQRTNSLETTSNLSIGGLERALLAARTAEDNRGTDIVILDMRELTSVFDFFIIASGTSRRQLHAMSEEIDRVFEQELGDRRLGIEGYEESRWILLDYGDLVIHLFEPETRDYYALEQLWSQAKRVPFEPRVKKGLGIGD